MKRFALLLLFALCAANVRADTFSIDSALYNDGTFFVGPYNSTWNGLHITSFCVDMTHEVGFGQVFDVTAINLADYQGPDKSQFEQAAFLTTLMAGQTDIPTLSLIQRAIWLITTPGTTDPYLTQPSVFAYTTLAFQQSYSTQFDSQFTLFERAGDAGQAQLALVPEPSSYASAGIGFLSLLGFLWAGKRQRNN